MDPVNSLDCKNEIVSDQVEKQNDSILSEETIKPNANIAKAKLSVMSYLSIGGIISGVISFILGVCTATKYIGGSESYSKYGGDAYTGIQNAAAGTSNNVLLLSNVIRYAMASLLIVFGLALIFYFGIKLVESLKKDNEVL